MAHPRKLIRHAIVDLLTDATVAGDRVTASRIQPYRGNELPAISVYTPDETVDPDSEDTAPLELTRPVEVEIACWVGHSDANPHDDRMDDIAEQVETAMNADPFLGGTSSKRAFLLRTTMQLREEDGRAQNHMGLVVLTYRVEYRTEPGAMTLDEFLRAKATHKFVGATDGNAPSDEFNVRSA